MIRSMGVFFQRELLRFVRQKGRLMATLITPFVFWMIMGHGFGSLLEETFLKTDSLTYFFPGILLMTILFSSVFSMISLVEDRNEGFLQGVRLIPQAPLKIVMGKVFASSVMALLQVLLILALAPLIDLRISIAMFFEMILILWLTSVLLSLIGFVFAWWLNSVQGFHAVMNVVLLPMWVLSGAVFPFDSASPWVQWVMTFNPLRLVIETLHQIMYIQYSLGTFFSSLEVIWLFVVLLLMIIFLGLACVSQVRRAGVISSS